MTDQKYVQCPYADCDGELIPMGENAVGTVYVCDKCGAEFYGKEGEK